MFPDAPEHWPAKGALSKDEDLFRIMADYAYDWEYWLCPDGSYVYISPSCERISGYSRDEFLKNPRLLEEIVHPEDRGIFSGHIHGSSPEAGSIDFRIITRAGKELWISHSCQPIYDSKGSYLGRRSSNRDITERKKMENALRESKEYLDKIINSIGDPLFVKDRQHRYILVNDSHCSFSGQGREEMIGKTSHDLFPKEQADVFWKKDEDVFHNGTENVNEEVVTDSLGRDHTFVTRKALYRDNAGNQFLVGISRDITDRKLADQELRKAKDDLEKIVEARTADLAKANEALRKSERFLNEIINSIGDPIFVKDRRHRLILVNDAACRLFDRTRDELLGQTSYDLFPSKEDADISWQKDEEVFLSRSENVNEETNTYAHGIARTVLVKKSPYADDAGNLFVVGVTRDITDRKRAEEDLRETRDFLENLIGYANAPIIVWDTSFKITRFNHAFERLTGRRADEVLGRPLEILFPEESREQLLVHIRRTLSGERWEAVEIPILRNDGSVRTILWNSANLYDEDGRAILATVAQGQDITERKEAEDVLKESERRLMDIIDFLPDATFVIDRAGRVIAWNHAIEAMTGIAAEDILGKGNYEYAIPFYGQRRPILIDLVLKRLEEIECRYAHIDMANGTLEGEAYMPNMKGGAVYLLGRSAVLYDSSGNIFGAIESIRDITERKRAEEALALERVKADNERRRLKAVLDALPVGAFIVDAHGKIVQINEQADRIWGRLASGIVDWRSYRARWADSGEAIRFDDWPLRRSLKYGEVFLARAIEIERFDGRRGTILSSSAPVKDEWGKITGAVSVILDITERKMMEEELQRAKEMAEEAIRAKSEFLANMSHEIRTPMNAVIGMTGLLLDSDLGPEQHEYVETIRNSGDALLSVINDILDFSKIESGKMELENQPFNLKSCIEGSIDLLAAAASEKGLDLGFSMDHSVPEAILGDPTRLRQVLINLLSNAVKFTENGEIKVKVTSKAVEGTRYQLHFEVRDTGIGIPPDRLCKLFLSFSQVDMSTTRRYGGTGLGLAISKRLVQAMGGIIWVESEPSKGSVFHFTMPAQASSRCLPGPKEVPVNPQSNSRINIRILLAEDNAVNRKVMLQMLRKLGYRADVAADGLEVIKALSRQHYDLVLMDIQMPEVDGLEATRQIRERWQKGPVIVALTAYALEGDRERCLEAGMDGYIAKPVKMDDLRDALLHCEAQVLEGSGMCLAEDEGTKCKE